MGSNAQSSFRVLVVTHYFPSHGGGIERVAERLVDRYLEEGWLVCWTASATDVPPLDSTNFTAIAAPAWNGLERVTGLPYPVWGWRTLRRLWREVRLADAVHVHEHAYIGSIVSVLFAAWLRRRIVLTQHVGELPFASGVAAWLYRIGTRCVARLVMSRASDVVFISDSTRAFFEGRAGDNRRLHTVYNGVDGARFFTQPEHVRRAFREELGISAGRPSILFVGRFVPKKGLPLLKQLAERLSDCDWIFVGRGPIDPKLWRLPNVRVLGHLDSEQLARVYGAVDLLALPSRGEGFPLVVQEALACGLPVLVSEETANGCSAARELVQTVSSMQPDAWALAIRRLLSHDGVVEEPARMQRATRAAQLWDWAKCGAAHMALLAADRS